MDKETRWEGGSESVYMHAESVNMKSMPQKYDVRSVLPFRDTKIIAESEFATPTITEPIPILYSTLGAFVAYNVNLITTLSNMRGWGITDYA